MTDLSLKNFDASDIFDMSGETPQATAIQIDNAKTSTRIFLSSLGMDVGMADSSPVIMDRSWQTVARSRIQLDKAIGNGN